jgi:hypothetical protein
MKDLVDADRMADVDSESLLGTQIENHKKTA